MPSLRGPLGNVLPKCAQAPFTSAALLLDVSAVHMLACMQGMCALGGSGWSVVPCSIGCNKERLEITPVFADKGTVT